ncbi:hypothetical protein KRR40_00895 [Niabella defluvii]|nr:hypothetical protein KRR40_00895 [Niabella sp. I65]
MQKSLLNNQKAIMLKDGSLGILGDEWLQQYGLLFRHGKVRKHELLVARWLTLSEGTDNENDGGLINTGITAEWFSRWKRWEKQEEALYTLPAGLQVQALRPYQRTGYEWLRLLSEIGASGCLADDMGLVKPFKPLASSYTK